MRAARIGRIGILAALAWLAAAQEIPRVLYVSPLGTRAGDGSLERPLDLATAIGPASPARPGDTILMRGGTYRGPFTSVLTGADSRPIVLRQYPGERVTLDPSLTIRGAWTWYWGFEVANSDPDRTGERPDGVTVMAPNSKLINLVVHDCGNGIGFWSTAPDSELYGCIIYSNGFQGPDPDRGHGHSLYVQNETGTKRIADNILFNGYAYGVHAYTERGSLKGMHFEGNMIFNSGKDSRDQWRVANMLIGGKAPAERITVAGNYVYHPLDKGTTVSFGYSAGAPNKDLVLRDNYLASGGAAANFYRWESIVASGNTYYGFPWLVEMVTPRDVAWSYQMDRNTFVYAGRREALTIDGRGYDLPAWQSALGFDRNSQWIASANGRATGVKVFVRPNQYEPGRLNIAVYNWDLRPQVEVDLQGLLAAGSAWEARPVQNWFGSPAASGVYDGKPIALPMVGTDSGPEFNVFVLTSRRAALPPRVRRTP